MHSSMMALSAKMLPCRINALVVSMALRGPRLIWPLTRSAPGAILIAFAYTGCTSPDVSDHFLFESSPKSFSSLSSRTGNLELTKPAHSSVSGVRTDLLSYVVTSSPLATCQHLAQ